MQKALVIGGTSGMGESLAHCFFKNNYHVAVTGIEDAKIQELKNSPINAFYFDGTKPNCSKEIEKIIDSLGGLDVLVLSAGIGNLNQDKGFKFENFANQLNVIGFTEIADWSFRYFKKQQKGHFVALTSVAGHRGYRKAPAYHAAKAYQINYLESLQHRISYEKLPIFVTDIRPGFVDTPMAKDKKEVFWKVPCDKAGQQIFNAISNKRKIAYISKRWELIGWISKIIPKYFLFKS